MDFFLIDDVTVDSFARAIIARYLSAYKWRTHKEYEDAVRDLRKNIVERFNGVHNAPHRP